MTASELVFLILGLGLGVVTGAALVEILRSRPPVPRGVRLIVQTDAIPRRRVSTLSDDAFTLRWAETARGGPADRRETTVGRPAEGIDRRTVVRSQDTVSALRTPVGISVTGGDDPILVALRSGGLAVGPRGRGPTDGGSPG